jgi:hypothetical protein
MNAGCPAAHRYRPANNFAVTAGAVAMAAGACTELWNLSPDQRAGQPEECLTTVTLYIAARRRFFQFEIGCEALVAADYLPVK